MNQKNKSNQVFQLQILGCNSALPANNRFPSAQVLNIREQLFLIDCGEGTQIQMSKFAVKRNRINQIFISHLHGDHVFGLAGLITSYNHFGRSNPLSIFAPPGIEEMIDTQLRCSGSILNFELNFIEVDPTIEKNIFTNEVVEVHTIPLTHRVPTCGYLFKEKFEHRNIDKQKIEEHQLSVEEIKKIKNGEGIVLSDLGFVECEFFLLPERKTRSFAYCSDTVYKESIVPQIMEVDLLYHETTFCEEHKDRADTTLHTTAKQAAQIAKLAKAGKLITGHYSSRYVDLSCILEEAKSIFPETELGIEGLVFSV